MPSSTARAMARSRSTGSPRTIKPPTSPQPKASAETLSPVLPSVRYSIGLAMAVNLHQLPGLTRRSATAKQCYRQAVVLSQDESDRQGEKGSHDEVEDSQPARLVENSLHGGAKRQPQEAAWQRGQNEQAAEGGGLEEGATDSGAEKRARGARAHDPGFRIDPLEDRGAEVADRLAAGDRIDTAGGRRD